MNTLSEAIEFARMKSYHYKKEMDRRPEMVMPRIYHEQFRALYQCLKREERNIKAARKKANKFDILELYLDASNLTVDQAIKIAKIYKQFKDKNLIKEIDKVISFFMKN